MQPTVYCGIALHVAWMDSCVIHAEGEVGVPHHLRPDPTAFLQALQPVREEGWSASWAMPSPGGRCPAATPSTTAAMPPPRGATAWRSHAAGALRVIAYAATIISYPHGPRDTRPSRIRPARRTGAPPWGRLARFEHRCGPQNMAVDVALVDCADPLRAALERAIAQPTHGHAPGSGTRLRPLPGVGNSRAPVMRSAIEPIARFPRVQTFGSARRWGKSAPDSHGTRDDTSGQTSGNAQHT